MICDRISENHPYGHILHIKYLALKSSMKTLLFVHLWFQYSKNALNYQKNVEIHKICFSDVRKPVANSKILIVSGAPIRVIFQNSVTYHTHTIRGITINETLHNLLVIGRGINTTSLTLSCEIACLQHLSQF